MREDDYDSDSDLDSDTNDSEDSGLATPTGPPAPKSRLSILKARLTPAPLPVLWRNVLKCAVAYFLASLFTFSPYLSGWMSDLTSYGLRNASVYGRRPTPSGHMVATIAVYFNPAKTTGAMLDADLFCLFGLMYSAFVCLSSMGVFWFLEMRIPRDLDWILDLGVILWLGAGMSIVAWLKVWMANPSFNTACSMMAIIIFVVIVKEGGVETLLQVSTIVGLGAVISNLVCFILWPQSATDGLRRNMENTLGSFNVLLGMLVNTFLGEGDFGERGPIPEGAVPRSKSRKFNYEKIKKAVEGHQSSFTSLKKSLAEAKSEWVFRATGERDLSPNGSEPVGSILGFIGSGGSRQAYEDAVDSMNRLAQHLNGLRSSTGLQNELARAGVLSRKRGKQKNTQVEVVEEDDEDTALLKAAAAMFGDFVEELGPPLKALSGACTNSLTRLRETFILSGEPTSGSSPSKRTRRHRTIQPHEFFELAEEIEKALTRFESTSNHAVLRLYRRSDANHSHMSASVSGSIQGSEVGQDQSYTSPESESIFLVYFFIFTLQEFSRELASLVDAMGRVYAYEQQRVNSFGWWRRALRSLRRPTYIMPPHRHTPPAFPKISPHAPNTIQTPPRSDLNFVGRWGQRLWALGKRLGERDMKYALKAGMATALLAAPAFFEQTRGIFVDFWGDWALISFFVVISPTIGATNYLGLQRISGTVVGAAVAAGVYSVCPDDPVVLSLFGFFFSIPCFYAAVSRPQYLSASRFVLLTYNLTCLYCYNARDSEVPVSVVDVALHRALAVTIGVAWAAIVSRVWWPAEARRELGQALGEFCLNIGWLYTRLVASNSFAPEPRVEGDDVTSGASTLSRPAQTMLSNSIQEFMAMELHLQIKLIELQGLLAQAQHEPRLKGPFPVALYRNILTSLQTILDKLHSMRCVTTREECVRQDFIVPVNKERREMVGNIILSFSLLASAFLLKAPLPPYLPPAEKARERLVNAIRRLDVVRSREVRGSRQLLFFAYALTMKGVTVELENLGRTLQDAFGVIGQTPRQFDALFLNEAGSRHYDNL
ncbi:hypothetical protein BDN72DRAFT_760046 [Pluteus cervinus]|uniref:Uncharacterized protein n=1 Tax=Pluteus cervinus TaxID=181527 RepID=A0ACD3B898_9AGAR|nr:hypothetical protein BDN72DRAFT_760046 [Pluteus cervinus]